MGGSEGAKACQRAGRLPVTGNCPSIYKADSNYALRTKLVFLLPLPAPLPTLAKTRAPEIVEKRNFILRREDQTKFSWLIHF